ncbi:cytochrome c oxidase, cbb3-type, CcoQ subunit [Helicobacter enhydrae]|uniref:Cytochrome c oxidase, cbb3-type, CcoQ subunit n=1 Tax=Helicobacter enhydrae TaxID=222136 RepID=A0A1B1U5S3_9HELI|nr:cytochrome c oxidase, cbb3-type, CcoQ subunit [Helicobacter enhydrae]ANV98106.1 cytochrome c oxidase, cbb3-type, CcoQ subunit [Helicobacter enhydrae]
MDIAMILSLQKIIYLIVTIILCVFLYSYIIYMYRIEKKGEKNYEKYARLALDDSMEDEIIERR